MIIEKESEIKALRNFCASPFEYFSIAEISERTGISRNWVYRITGKFEKFGILEKSGNRFKLDFTNSFCKRLKMLFDSEHLQSLEPDLLSRISSITDRIAFEMNPDSIVLVGSFSLGRQRKGSDLDFLAIGAVKRIPLIEDCNIVQLSLQEAREKYLKGDDFLLSAILFGKVIQDREVFMKFFESPLPIFSQEMIQEKIRYCEMLVERIYSLLKSDEKQAEKELLYLALQAARIVLLRKRIVPRTKYDIAGQVRAFDQKLARIIDEILDGKVLGKEKILGRMKSCMEAVG